MTGREQACPYCNEIGPCIDHLPGAVRKYAPDEPYCQTRRPEMVHSECPRRVREWGERCPEHSPEREQMPTYSPGGGQVGHAAGCTEPGDHVCQPSREQAADAAVLHGYGDRPWRTGRKVFRTVYDTHDTLIGVMDTPMLAQLVVSAVNELARRDRSAPARDEP